jgi:hypothetical protein
MADHLVSLQAQVRALAKAVAAAFAASNLTDAEKAPGKIEIVDLPWQAPPLITSQTLSGAGLQDYFDAPMQLEQHKLHAFWVKTLDDMWLRPSALYHRGRGALANCGRAMPSVRVGQRAFRFSRPSGWPVLDELAGALFSLEVAHAAATSLPVRDVISDDDSYFVEFADGMQIGVQGGLPLCESRWKVSVAGMVPELLTMPRGDADYSCRYDQLASLRSVLHVHRSRFPTNFEALDQALQALRLLSTGAHCPDLLQAVQVVKYDAPLMKERERALADALDVISVPTLSDRSKLQSLRAVLVPAVLTVSNFKRHIYASDQFPFTLARGRVDVIRNYLAAKYQELPAEIQREDVCRNL